MSLTRIISIALLEKNLLGIVVIVHPFIAAMDYRYDEFTFMISTILAIFSTIYKSLW